MGNELATAVLSGSRSKLVFDAQQRQIIRDTYARGANDAEFGALMAVAEARGLDPRMGHVHFVKRFDTQLQREIWSTQVSIDGLRTIAERTGDYDGQDEPEYVMDGDKIVACKVKIYRKSVSRPFVGVAYFAEYVQKKRDGTITKFWSVMPRVMSAKCAEAIGLRKAFPQDMARTYIPEEMGHEEVDASVSVRRQEIESARESSPAIAAMRDDLSQLESPTVEHLVAIWLDHRRAITDEAAGEVSVIEAAQAELLSRAPSPMTRNAFNVAVTHAECRAKHTPVDMLARGLATCATPADAVARWIAFRDAIGALDEAAQNVAKTMLSARVKALDPTITRPASWIASEIKTQEAKAPAPVAPREREPGDDDGPTTDAVAAK